MPYSSMFHPVSKTFSSSAAINMSPGQVFTDGSRKYMFVKNIAAAVHVKGAPCYPASVNDGEIGKAADIIGAAESCIGAAQSAIPASGYGFMLMEGFVTAAEQAVLGDGSIGITEYVKAAADTFDTGTLGTNVLFGSALLNDTPYVTMYFKAPTA